MATVAIHAGGRIALHCGRKLYVKFMTRQEVAIDAKRQLKVEVETAHTSEEAILNVSPDSSADDETMHP